MLKIFALKALPLHLLMRFLSRILLPIVFLASLGLKINQHYCQGELVVWEFLFGQTPKDCSGQRPEKRKKCCEDKIQHLKTDDSRMQVASMLPVKVLSVWFLDLVAVPELPEPLSWIQAAFRPEAFCQIRPPNLLRLFLKYRNLRI